MQDTGIRSQSVFKPSFCHPEQSEGSLPF